MNTVIIIIGFAIVIYILVRILLKISQKPKKVFLSIKLGVKSDKAFFRRLHIFRRKYHREPTFYELKKIVRGASHDVIRKRGYRAHWIRQKIRKYLYEKHHIMKKYRMR